MVPVRPAIPTGPLKGVDPTIVNEIRQASRNTNVDFGYLLAQARQESGFDPDAKASTSSATGLFQFIDTTWLSLVRQHGQKYGVGELAKAIETAPDGRAKVADPEVRKTILDLRRDPKLSSALAGEFAKANRQEVERGIGRKANSTDLYLAHFLGASGATEFLKTIAADAHTKAADLLPEAASANRNVFYDRTTGEARSVADIYRNFATKMEHNPVATGAAASGIPDGTADAAGGATSGLPLSTASRLNELATKLSQPMVAMFNVLALSAIKMLNGGETPSQLVDPAVALSTKVQLDDQERRHDNQIV